MESKLGVKHYENTPRAMSDAEKIDIAAKHGDRALAIIGDGRISLTEEDVRFHPMHQHLTGCLLTISKE